MTSPPPTAVDTHRLRWIAFDAVGTLLRVSPPVAEVYGRVGRRLGSRLIEPEIVERFPRVFAAVERDDGREADWNDPARLTTNEERERRRWREIVAAVLDDVTDRDRAFEELFAHFARPEAWVCYPDVQPTLTALAAAGYRLAIASNFDARLHPLCDHLPELRPVALRVISSEVGYRKPSAYFYRALLDAAGCAPHEMLMVGDDLLNDVQGARRAGLPAVRLRRSGTPAADEVGSLRDLIERLRR